MLVATVFMNGKSCHIVVLSFLHSVLTLLCTCSYAVLVMPTHRMRANCGRREKGWTVRGSCSTNSGTPLNGRDKSTWKLPGGWTGRYVIECVGESKALAYMTPCEMTLPGLEQLFCFYSIYSIIRYKTHDIIIM